MTKHKTGIGRIFKKRRKLADGTFIDHTTWTVRYRHRDYATGETDAKKAEKFLLKLAGNIAAGKEPTEKPAPAAADILVMDALFDSLNANARRRGNATAADREMTVAKHLRPFFGRMDATALTSDDLDRYVDERIAAEAKPATINIELALLKRSLNLAKKATPPKIKHYPAIEMLPVSNTRKGFLTKAKYTALKNALPAYVRPVFVAGYHIGSRKGELLQVEFRDIEMDAKPPQFRLYPDATKNGEGRVIPIYGEMVEVFKAQIERTRREYPGCPWLFNNEGQPMCGFYKAWKTATEAVGLNGLLFHDLRRTAVRNLVRSGTSRTVARAITGHKTEHVFERYNITDEKDLRAAAAAMTVYLNEAE